MRDRGERVADAGLGHPGRLDDHLDLRTGDQRRRIVAHMGAAGLVRLGVRARRVGLRVPAGGAQLVACPRHIEIGNADHVHAGRAAHLGEEHGAELAGADQPDGDRAAGRGAFEELGVQVHAPMLSLRAKRSNLTSLAHEPVGDCFGAPGAPRNDEVFVGYRQSERVT
jgi:hypothetical protein